MSSHSNFFIDESEKLMVKASCDLKYDIIVVSNDILVEGGSLKETPLAEPFDKEVVDVMPRDMECVDLSIEYCLGRIHTFIVMLSMLLFQSSMNPSMSILIGLKIFMIDAPNLEHNITVGL